MAVIDYSRPSTEKRLWVFDVDRGTLLHREHVAHGQGSGEKFARKFSNIEGSYQTSLGPVSLDSETTSENYGVYGRAGWISRISPRDEVAASVEVWQMWQRVKGYSDPAAVAFNPFDANVATGTDKTNLVKIGALAA